MQNLKKIALTVTLFISFFGNSQIDFYKIYTNNGYDFGQGIVQLEDSSYVVTGSSSSFVEGASQAFLLKIDSVGNYIWSHPYGGLESEEGRRVMYKKNEGFYVAGYTNSIGKGGYDAYLFKTDEVGNQLWEKSYGGTGWEKINDAIMLADTGIMMVGQSNTGTAGNENIYIVRTDKFGDTLWTKHIGEAGDDIANCIRYLNDSICIIGGQVFDESTQRMKAFLMSVKIDGTIYWDNIYGNIGDYRIRDISIDGAVITGVGDNLNDLLVDYDLDEFVIRVDTSGVVIAEYITVKLGEVSHSLITTYGEMYKLYIAYEVFNFNVPNPSFPVGKDLFVSRFNSSPVYWEGGFGITNPGNDIGGQIIATNDGGSVLVGFNTSFGAGGNNVFVCKIGANNVFPITSEVPISNTLVQIFENSLIDRADFSIYPNPSDKDINVEVFSNYNKIIITNITGQTVLEINNEQFIPDFVEQNKVKINIESLENGNYFVSVISDNSIYETKMITVVN